MKDLSRLFKEDISDIWISKNQFSQFDYIIKISITKIYKFLIE